MFFEYYVDKFDNLQTVSKKFNVQVAELIENNNINNGELPEKIIIPIKNERQFNVVANMKREYLFIGNCENSKVALNKKGLYCSETSGDVCLFKPSNTSIYVVGVLDSLNSVSKKFNIQKQDLIKINNLKTEKLFIGQILKLS